MPQNPDTMVRLRRREHQQQNAINRSVGTVLASATQFSQKLDSTKLLPTSVLTVEGWFAVTVASSNTLTIALTLGGVTLATLVSAAALTGNATVYVDCRIVVTSASALTVFYTVTGVSGVMPGQVEATGLTLTGNPTLAYAASLGTVNGDSVAQTFMQVQQ